MMMDGRGGGNPMHEALLRLAQRKRQKTPWDHIPPVPGEIRGSDYRGMPEEYAQPTPPVMPGPPVIPGQPADDDAGWLIPGRPHPGMPRPMPMPVDDLQMGGSAGGSSEQLRQLLALLMGGRG